MPLAVRPRPGIRARSRPAGARSWPSPGRLARDRARYATVGPWPSVRFHHSSGKHGIRRHGYVPRSGLAAIPSFSSWSGGRPSLLRSTMGSWGPCPHAAWLPAKQIEVAALQLILLIGRGRPRLVAAPSPAQSPVWGRPRTPAAALEPKQAAAKRQPTDAREIPYAGRPAHLPTTPRLPSLAIRPVPFRTPQHLRTFAATHAYHSRTHT